MDQPRFLNQVVEVDWPGTARQLLREAKAVEREGGRVRVRRWGPRIIDVDVLLFGSERLSAPGLCVPHPGILQRPFVLESLRELGVTRARIRRLAGYAGRALVKR